MSSCRAYSTACITISDTLISAKVNLDSIKKLVPKGVYLLNEEGARLSIKSAIDAKAYQEKWQLADTELGKMSATVSLVTVQRNQAVEDNARKDEKILQLSKKLRSATFWQYAAIAVAAGFGAQLLFK